MMNDDVASLLNLEKQGSRKGAEAQKKINNHQSKGMNIECCMGKDDYLKRNRNSPSRFGIVFLFDFKIILKSGATSLFDVRRSMFDVGRSSFNMFDVHLLTGIY